MDVKRLIKRVYWLPLGMFKNLLDSANDKARDFQNKRHFPEAIFDSGSSLSQGSSPGVKTRICENCIINHSHIGSHSYVNYSSLIQHTKIGNYCSIAHDVKIGLGAHPLNLFSTSTIFYKNKNTFSIED